MKVLLLDLNDLFLDENATFPMSNNFINIIFFLNLFLITLLIFNSDKSYPLGINFNFFLSYPLIS